MNTYYKFTANVFVAKCEERQEKGEIITLTTKYGKENDCIIFNLVGKDKDGNFYYSILRADGFNFQDYCKKKADKLQAASQNAENKSTEFWKASHEGRDFLAMGEPIKVGHHSEKRHRALIDRNHNRMSKSVEQTKIAENYESRAEYWERKAKDINLSMPESIEFYEYKHEEAKERHEGLKSGKYERSHSYSLTYAKKAVNEAEKNLKTAQKLWE